jgi:MOSC domain-containing protein YiiM
VSYLLFSLQYVTNGGIGAVLAWKDDETVLQEVVMPTHSPQNDGIVAALSISRSKGEKKTNIPTGRFIPDHGIAGDAHAGDWHRQVSLLGAESIAKIQAAGMDVHPGDFAENVTTAGLRLYTLPIGTRLQLGDAVRLEVTQIGKTCHNRCQIFHQVGDCVMPREGIFARVLQGGDVKVGDKVLILQMPTAVETS